MQDVLVWFASDESEGIDVVAGDVLEATDLVVDVFGQKLAAWFEDVILVFEDICKGRTGSVVPQFTLTSSIHRI